MTNPDRPLPPNGGIDPPLSAAMPVDELIFVSGQLAMRDGRLAGADIESQTHLALDNVERALRRWDSSLDDVIKTTVWLSRKEDFERFNAAYGSRFAHAFPARSTTVAELLIDGALVEIDAVAKRRTHRAPFGTPALAD
ncbi:RidA family protein [Sphingopyxis sp. Q841]|uniref:RidA family protein n=1 Tax=Sphingopyxis sp. Q841 TaxID=3458250 RepID=UPI0040354041